ncbi:hypothetical protein ACFWCA_19030 [Streptomyces phaeochromogenes]|uniref:hypothetical protein n=1 Tax=Streptomyces phaeochromogenes TaxID=1923 RepID=UPI0036AA97DA
MIRQDITARDVPEIRAELATWLTDAGPNGGPAVWSDHHDPAMAVRERRVAADSALRSSPTGLTPMRAADSAVVPTSVGFLR